MARYLAAIIAWLFLSLPAMAQINPPGNVVASPPPLVAGQCVIGAGGSKVQTNGLDCSGGPGVFMTTTGANAVLPTARQNHGLHVGQFFAPEDYGAVGNGVADDTTAVKAAITAACAAATHAVFLAQNYVITSSLAASCANLLIYGQGEFQSGLIVSSNTFDLIQISGAGYVTIQDITLASFGQSGTHAFYAINDTVGIPFLTVENVKIFGFDNGINSPGATTTIDNIWLTGTAGGTGINFTTTAEIRRVTRSVINSGAVGIKISGGSAIDLISDEVQGGGYGLLVQTTSLPVNSLNIVNSYFDSTTTGAILLDTTAGGAVHRVSITGSWISSSSGNGLEIKGNGEVVSGVHIANSEIFGNGGDGVVVDGGVTATGLVLTGNLIAGNAGDGVHIGAGVSGFTITGNIIGPAADFGANGNGLIIDTGASNDFVVSGNKITGNTTTNYSAAASGFAQLSYGNLTATAAGPGAVNMASQFGNNASGTQSFIANGFANFAGGFHSSIGGGDSNNLHGSYSVIPGGNSASDRSNFNVMAFASGAFATTGDAQTAKYVLRGTGATTSAIRCTGTGGAASTTNVASIPTNTSYEVQIRITAIDHTTPANSVSWGTWDGIMTRGSGNAAVSMAATPTPISTGTGATATIAITADTTNQGLNISFTPPALNTDTWNVVATIETVEVQ